MPFTPPAALISLIAIMVASCSDFSTIDSPPVSENRTPTLISPAACAPVENTQGDVINAPPARAPPFRNLRLSTVIPHSPLAPDTSLQTRVFGRAEARWFPARNSPRQIEHRQHEGHGKYHSIQKQKSPTDPRGSFGLPSQSQTSIIDGSAKSQEIFS